MTRGSESAKIVKIPEPSIRDTTSFDDLIDLGFALFNRLFQLGRHQETDLSWGCNSDSRGLKFEGGLF